MFTEQAPEKKLTHPCFPQPQDTSTRVWRYMDLAKLIWLLDSQKLWLSRLDLLKDSHEGSIPRLLAMYRNQSILEQGVGDFGPQISHFNQRVRNSTYISCWRLGNAETESMWRLYCPGEQGIALQTSYQKLLYSVLGDPHLFIGCVVYIDYESEGFPLDNLFYPVMHKRLNFAHEQEVRLVKMEHIEMTNQIGPPGITIDWLLEAVIDAIYVNPYAPEYYSEVVRSVVRNFAPALEDRVCWSRMRSDPVY